MSEGDSPQPDMTPERWHQIRDLLADAIRLSAQDRSQYLVKVCGDDSGLRAELESLIAAHEIAERGTFEKPAFDTTARTILVGDRNRTGDLFETALPLDSSQRATFLAQNCANDQIREPVDRLLAKYQEAGGSLLNDSVRSLLAEAHSTETEDPMVGRRFGAYKLVKRVGQGGMAAVFLAMRADDEYQMEVAVKLVQPGLDSCELLDRFRNERQTLAGLDHPNIVKLLDGSSTPEGLPFLVMDYVNGSPIDVYCDRLKLSIDERLRLFSKICEAVQYAHQKGVVHRDLKPSNILVTADGTPKLLDFGIAKVLTPTAGTPLVTHTGTKCMTPAYASPEQVCGKVVTPATDIYSLGVLLYELLTGHRPYRLKEHTTAEMERAICEQEAETPSTAVSRLESETSWDGTAVTKTPEQVSQVREGKPEKLRRRLQGDLDNILLKALCKEPRRRYGSVQEFARDIDRHLRHLPVTARPSSLGYKVSKFVQRRKTEVAAGVMCAFVLATAAVIFTLHMLRVPERLSGSTPNLQIRSVVVLPLVNLSGDPAQEYFSDGMTDALITGLSQIGSLEVISRTSSFQYKQTSKSVRDIARELNVDGIVEGTVQRSGDHVRVAAQLIHGPSDNHIWADSYDRDTRDLLTLERDLTREIAHQIQAQLKASNQSPLPQHQPLNPDALEAYLQGNYHLNGYAKGAGDEEKRKAAGYLQQAIAAEPNFAPAYTALANAHLRLLWPSPQDAEIARRAVERALALDPNSSDARDVLGYMKLVAWDWPGAEAEYRRAIALNPNNANAHDDLAELLDEIGRLEEGWRERQIAQELDPANDHLSSGLERRAQFDRAIAMHEMMLKSHPDNGYRQISLYRDYVKKGMYEEALLHLERMWTLIGLPQVAAEVRRARAGSGYSGAMRESAKAFERLLSRKQVFAPVNIAEFYATLGDKDRAFYWLEQAYTQHDTGIASTDVGLDELNAEFLLDPLHSDPRFKDLVRRIGLPP